MQAESGQRLDPGDPSSSWSRISAAIGSGWRQLGAHAPLLLGALVVVGLVLRGWYWLVYQPAALNLYDTSVYVSMAAGELFSDPSRPAGYPLLLRGLHLLSERIELVIAFQHLIGIATGLLLYATVRRIGAPWWAGVAAAAAVLLSLDQVFLEQALMPETAFTFALVASAYGVARALDEPSLFVGRVTTRAAWIALAGATLGLSAWLRPVTAPLIPFFALWLLYAIPGGWRPRLGAAAVGSAFAVIGVLGYFTISATHTDHFGFSKATGWALYSRVAPIADCGEFEPPAGTRRLCEATPPSERFGPDFYGWQEGSPARMLFGGPPVGDERLRAFAQATVLNQPLEYAKDVVRDFARYFVELSAPHFSGVGYELVEVDRRAPGVEEDMLESINAYYVDRSIQIEGGVETLGSVQDVLRVRNTLLLLSLGFALVGIVLARGRGRAGLILLTGISLLAMLVPVVTAIYSARYAIPVTGLLVGAGATGLGLTLQRTRDWVRSD